MAYHIFENDKKNLISSIIIKALFVLRFLFFFSFVISAIAFFVFDKPANIIIILLFFCLAGVILTDLTFETAILAHAFAKDKKEWEELNYYEYFTSAKSVLSPFSYRQYYNNNF